MTSSYRKLRNCCSTSSQIDVSTRPLATIVERIFFILVRQPSADIISVAANCFLYETQCKYKLRLLLSVFAVLRSRQFMSNSSMTLANSGPATIQRRKALGFCNKLTAPPSRLSQPCFVRVHDRWLSLRMDVLSCARQSLLARTVLLCEGVVRATSCHECESVPIENNDCGPERRTVVICRW